MTKKAKKTLVVLLVIFVTLHVTTIFANERNQYKAENAEKLENTNKTSISSLPFISTWQTTTANEEIRVPISTDDPLDFYTIDWGDGIVERRYGWYGEAVHTYSTAGTKTIQITYGQGGVSINFFNNNSKDKIYDITQWGDIVWGEDMSNGFYECTQLNITAIDAPDLTNTTIYLKCFMELHS